MRRAIRRGGRRLTPLAAALLASCAALPPAKPPVPSAGPPSAAPAAQTAPAPTVPAQPAAKPRATDLWDALRDSFAMDDCDGDPAITHWARRFTANRTGFEHHLESSLPRLRFIQSVAARHQVAGEFVLLPWVESRYRPVHGRGGQPGGMWQIVPATAGTLGLKVSRRFDGRMDVEASTEAVMTMLERYHRQFGDWRLVDYAFNAGEFAIRRLVAIHGAPPPAPVIPRLPVRRVTREHLIKLLAIACVVREPARFHVTLPTLPEDQHLVAVPVEHPMTIGTAASHAGMSVDALRRYNAAFLDNRIDPARASSLLLPGNHVDQFVDAMREAGATADAPPPVHDLEHTVRSGESLWEIAHQYGLSVKQLARWNGLRGNRIHPGQTLRLEPPQSRNTSP
ncbi:MAG TPA: LysM peptidoglycan-binding domain-containing protein [Dyella sp.]|nr:LysM peptidoglycan-binding domain-containing protein [Dyella sp.]